MRGKFDRSGELVQAVACNFDATISSSSGLQSTHAMALLLTQLQSDIRVDMCECENKLVITGQDKPPLG